MDLSLVILICFVALTATAGAAMLLVRDLFVPGDAVTGRGLGLVGKRRSLRRVPTVFDEAPAHNISGKIDQAFDRLVLESGYDMTPVVAFLMLVACGLFVGGLLWTFSDNVMAGIAGAALGMIVPLIALAILRGRRLRIVREELPPALDLLARAVRAGESLDQAIALLGEEAGGALGREFARCTKQLQMGRSLDAVMKTLARRIRLMEIQILATTLTIHRQTGGHLAETLERMSAVVRLRLSARRQMRAATGAGRASTILVATICPVTYLIMFFWQPEHMRVFYEDPLGQTMLAVAIVLEVVGVLWAVALLRQDS